MYPVSLLHDIYSFTFISISQLLHEKDGETKALYPNKHSLVLDMHHTYQLFSQPCPFGATQAKGWR